MGTLANVTKEIGGREVGREYLTLLTVQLVSGDQVTVSYDNQWKSQAHMGVDRSWQDLFGYVSSVAPHIRMGDHRQAH